MTDPGHFIIFRRLTLRGFRFFFRAVASNGEPVAQSEAYNDKRSAIDGIAALKRICAFGETKDEA